MQTQKQTQTPESVRREIRRRLGDNPAIEKAWTFFSRPRGDVERVLKGELSLDDLIDSVLDFLEFSGVDLAKSYKAPKVAVKGSNGLDRALIVSRLVAEEAAKHPDVVAFRRDHLNGKLLTAKEVEPWIRARASADGPPTVWLEVPVHEDSLKTDQSGLFTEERAARPTNFNYRSLSYAVPDSRWQRSVSTARDGILGRLRELADTLAALCEWEQAAACMFVLTGQAPLVEPIKANIRYQFGGLARRVIKFEVDPTVRPQELIEIYRRLRQQIAAGERVRELSDKHLALGAFSTEHGDEPWDTRLKAWNRKYPKWRYKQQSNFRRDWAKTRGRLLGGVVSIEKAIDHLNATMGGAVRLTTSKISRPRRKQS